MTPGNTAGVTDIPIAADLSRVRARGNIDVSDVCAIEGDTGRIPRVDVVAQVARLPAERARTIKAERRCNRGCHRAADPTTSGGSRGQGQRGVGARRGIRHREWGVGAGWRKAVRGVRPGRRETVGCIRPSWG